MSVVFKNNTLYVNDEPVIHEGSDGFAEMQQLCWVWVGDKRVIQPVTTRVFAKDLENLCEDIRVHGHRVATIQSYFKKCYGDELTDGGVISGTKGGPAYFITGSPSVKYKGVPLVRRGDLIVANNRNSAPGPWQDSTPFSPLFEDKCVSSALDPSKKNHNIQIQIELNQNATEKIVPFQRAICISTNQNEQYFKHITGVSAESNQLIINIPVNAAETYDVKECLNDPTEGVYAVHQGRGNMQMMAVDLKAFNTPEENDQHIQNLFKDAWIYLLKDGNVWREFQASREVNLTAHAGKHIRPANIPIERGFLLNMSDDDGKHEYAYATSPVQLTWYQMHSLSEGIHAIDSPSFEKYPEEPPPEGLLTRDTTFQYPHPAVAVIHVKDPLSNAVDIADQIHKLHDFHIDELQKYTDLYHSAKLVGEILNALKEQGEDYRQHVRDDERLVHIDAFEKSSKAYQDEIDRLTQLLLAFIKKSDDAWRCVDFNQLHHIEKIAQHWWAIGTALNQTQTGRHYVTEVLKNEESNLNQLLSSIANATISPNTRGLALGLLEVIALPAAAEQEIFKKLIAWVNVVFNDMLNVSIHAVPLQDIYAQAKKKLHPIKVNPHNFVVKVTDTYHLFTLNNDTGPDTKLFHIQRHQSVRMSLDLVDDVRMNGTPIHHMAHDFLNNPKLHRIFVALSSANVLNITRQLMTLQVSDHERAFLWIELSGGLADTVASLARISQINQNALHKIGNSKAQSFLSRAFTAVGPRLSLASTVLYAGADFFRGYDAIESGDHRLALAHGTNLASAVFTVFVPIVQMSRGVASLLFFFTLTTSVALFIVGFALMTWFHKNAWEKWLFNSAWGASDIRVHSYHENLLALFKIMPMITLRVVKYQHHSLKQNALELTLHVVPIPHAVMTGTLLKKEAFDELTQGKPLPAHHYSRYHHVDEKSGYMTIHIPPDTLPAPGQSLILSLAYLLPFENEYMTIESRHFKIEYSQFRGQYDALETD